MSTEPFIHSSASPIQYNMHLAAPSLYDGTSEESSPSSPSLGIQQYDPMYPNNTYYNLPQFPYVYQETEFGHGSIEPIPLEFNIEGLYDETDRRRKKNPKDKNVSSQVHSAQKQRRRAQNRASQRAFRDRKEKHVKELEHKLQELEEKYNELGQSHELLQHEYDTTKKQLSRLLEENESLRTDGCSSTTSELVTPDNEFDPGKGGAGLLFNSSEGFFFNSGVSKD